MAHAISMFQLTEIIAIKLIATQETYLIRAQGSGTVSFPFRNQRWLSFGESLA